MKNAVSCILLLVGCLAVTSVNTQVLLYASTPEFSKHSGLYGGTLKTTASGEIQVEQKVSAHCYHSEDGLSVSMKVRAVTVDDWTRTVLIWLDGKEVTLLKGHTCQLDQTCTNSSVTMLIDSFGASDEMGPFAMHKGEVYFVAKVKKVVKGEKVAVYEVRKIDLKRPDCKVKDFPISGGSLFTGEHCTEFAGILLQEYDNEKLKPLDIKVFEDGDHMRSIVSMESRVAGDDGVTHEYIMQLILTDKDKVSYSKSLTTEKVWPNYSSWVFTETGGVAYRNGKVCLAAMDSIICWKYDNEELLDKQVVLQKGESATSGACAEKDNVLSNLTTGVDFIQKEDELLVFFGCLPRPGAGGAGVIRVMKDGTTTVHPLRTNTSNIVAGSMAVADDCLDYVNIAYTDATDYSSAPGTSSLLGLLPSLLVFILVTMFHLYRY